MSGVFLRHGEALVRLREVPYDEEVVFQQLLEQHPEVLVGDDAAERAPWLLVRREASVALGDGESGLGRLDHLFVDAAGVPTLVEVKRSTDTRIRREVVGQLLDYAASARAHWGVETLRTWFEERCERQGEDAEQVLLGAFPDAGSSDDFWLTVQTNLAADRLRLVFVADAVPAPLRRIVEYLNRQMVGTEVLAIEVKRYQDETGAHQTIVPRVVGQTEAARATKGQPGGSWNRGSLLARFVEQGGDRHATVARRLFAWADARGDLVESFGRGTRDGSWSAGYMDQSRYLWPFVLYTYGRVELQFQHIAKRPPFDDPDRRNELGRRINEIAGVNVPRELLDKRPSIPLDLLGDDALAQLIETLDWAYDQAVAQAAVTATPTP
jgi:hypothetical protein